MTMRSTLETIYTSADQSMQALGHLLGHVDRLVEDIADDSKRVATSTRQLVDGLTSASGALIGGARATPRAVRIAMALTGLAARYRIEQARSRDASDQRARRRMEQLHQRGAQRLFNLCVGHGGLLIKMGQFASMRPDLLPAAYTEALGQLRDRVPAVPTELVVERIERELGAPVTELFADFDVEPVATASLAQVHRAVTPAGRAVAVKVQHAGVDELLAGDALLLRSAARALADGELPFDLVMLVDELITATLKETDFAAEADNCRAMAAALASDPRITTPRVVEELSTRRVLTMTWLDGVPLDRFLANSQCDRDRRQVLDTVVDSFCAQVLDHGLFHADAHSGNILVGANLEIGLVDFGCVQQLSERNRNGYRRLLSALSGGDDSVLAARLRDLGFDSAGSDTDLTELADSILAAFRDPGALVAMAADPAAAIAAIGEQARLSGYVRTPRHFVLLGRVLSSLGGLLIEHASAGVSLPAILARRMTAASG